MRRVFTDFHHSSLLRSTVLLFEERLGMEVYRPIGMEWYEKGFWAINNQLDTAKQYLSMDQAFEPTDGTSPLNKLGFAELPPGIFRCADPGGETFHKGIEFDTFKEMEFDFIIASIPAHIPIFKALIEQYQPKAKLIVQMGNNWNIEKLAGFNVLASIKPQFAPGVNALFYHQEFDTQLFHPSEALATRNIYSFVNVIANTGGGYTAYKQLKGILERQGFNMKSFGGQCPDGNMTGARMLADKMREAMMIYHVKPGGDGFGHIIHNAYAVGRPVITRPSHYENQLAEDLLVPGTFIDLDKYGVAEAKNMIVRLAHSPSLLLDMGRRAAQRFSEVVDYNKEAKEVWLWLENLL